MIIQLQEWDEQPFNLPDEQRTAFIQYLNDVWMKRTRYDEEVISKPSQQRFFNFPHNGISACNYVGVVQFEGIRIEVCPKILPGQSSFSLNLLYWLSYCRKIKFPFSLANISSVPFNDFIEILIYLFSHYGEEVLSRQHYQTYQQVEEETVFLKGNLLFDDYIKNNLVTGKWQHFYCSHQPFTYDNLFNRIIKFVAKQLLSITKESVNRNKLDNILFLLDEVTDITCVAGDCDKVKLSPLYTELQEILDIARLFLSGQIIDMSTENNRNFCFLLPMEYVFEDFIFGFLSREWQLPFKDQSMSYLAKKEERDVFAIFNDIYLADRLIIDTKYKVREYDERGKEGVSQSDMYQMLSYAVIRHCKDVLLLYPATADGYNDRGLFKIAHPMLTDRVNIHTASIDITFDDIHTATSTLKKRFESIESLFI